MKSPTKAQEIAVLDEAISKLGTDSYLGPWLKEVRDEAQSLMRSDVIPEILLATSVERANRIYGEASSKAKDIVADAEAKAKRIVDSATSGTIALKESARKVLQECANRL